MAVNSFLKWSRVLGGQGKTGKVGKDPVVFQRVIDQLHQFASQCDLGFASPAPVFDPFIEALQIGAVTLGHQSTLHQSRSRQLAACDLSAPHPPGAYRLSAVALFMPSPW